MVLCKYKLCAGVVLIEIVQWKSNDINPTTKFLLRAVGVSNAFARLKYSIPCFMFILVNDCWFYVTECTWTYLGQFPRKVFFHNICGIFKILKTIPLIDKTFLVFNLKFADKCIIRFLLFSFRPFKLNCRNSKIRITDFLCNKTGLEVLFWRSFIFQL